MFKCPPKGRNPSSHVFCHVLRFGTRPFCAAVRLDSKVSKQMMHSLSSTPARVKAAAWVWGYGATVYYLKCLNMFESFKRWLVTRYYKKMSTLKMVSLLTLTDLTGTPVNTQSLLKRLQWVGNHPPKVP